ncbi:hypothetical protein LA303_00830 [Candidatus Sulfidibacterium hydrothermale]|uniref:hypothetical protein n=1 Tax=Candidatus Sulfidibacterium hydrothermale TaxID=2875962 RepID=UPI001F0B0468|nr:hypothetical protein [Candidatus Sulfidibacterium hydrothermale]UBM62540.1 hypothetical protein LA303_00830 [Candidatus Sulfidibacterium hydrothermale]
MSGKSTSKSITSYQSLKILLKISKLQKNTGGLNEKKLHSKRVQLFLNLWSIPESNPPTGSSLPVRPVRGRDLGHKKFGTSNPKLFLSLSPETRQYNNSMKTRHPFFGINHTGTSFSARFVCRCISGPSQPHAELAHKTCASWGQLGGGETNLSKQRMLNDYKVDKNMEQDNTSLI